MARPLRIERVGGFCHVTSRGDRREDIFLCEMDRCVWLEILGEVCKRFHWICHAWCQMTNHYHVVMETVEGNLSQGMRHLNGVYTQRLNRTHHRVGHVFQGRYRSIIERRAGSTDPCKLNRIAQNARNYVVSKCAIEKVYNQELEVYR